jgi:hypothetical protein
MLLGGVQRRWPMGALGGLEERLVEESSRLGAIAFGSREGRRRMGALDGRDSADEKTESR